MRLLTNLVKRNLILNKRRTIVTIISIILSCALIGGVATLIASFQSFMQRGEAEMSGGYHVILHNVPVEDKKYIENNPYVKEYMESINIGYSKLQNSKNEYKPYLYITSYDKKKIKDMPIELEEGRLPSNENEIVITNQIITDGSVNYKIGDKVTLDIGDRYLNNEKLNQFNPYLVYEYNGDNAIPKKSNEEFKVITTKQYKIVGIIDTSNSESYSSPGYTVINYYNNKITSYITTMDISLITKNPKDIYNKINDMAKEINLDISNIEYHDSLLRWYGVSDNDNANKMLYGFAAILIAIIMISSIIVIYNSFNISITERKKQFGMLSSIGTTSKQIKNMVLKEGFILSLIGIPLGIIGSIVGIGITLYFVNSLNIFGSMVDTKFALVISPLSILITIILGILTIFISSLIPAIKASRTSPIDAIRLTSDIKIKAKKLKTSRLTNKLFGFEGELGLKNMKRNKGKYRSTIISLFVSIVLFMAINGFANYSFKSTLKIYKDYNFNVAVTNASNNFYNKIIKLNNITNYSIVNTIGLTTYLDESEINKKAVNGIKDNFYNKDKKKYTINVSLYTLGDKEFNRYIKENKQDPKDYKDLSNPQIILAKESNFYDQNNNRFYQIALTNLKENDDITLNNGNITIKTVKIGKISSLFPTGFSTDNVGMSTLQGYISNDLYDSLDNSIKGEDSYIVIESSNPNKLTNDIKTLMKDENITANVQNVDEMVKMLNNVVLAISIFLYGFIILVSLITVTNVINTITTSIYLRRREFAMLKAIGMTNKSFNRMIRFESIIYGLKSLLYGLPFGILVDYFLYKNVSRTFVYDYRLPIDSILICVIAVLIIISITMAYSVRKIKNDNLIDVIKEDNI